MMESGSEGVESREIDAVTGKRRDAGPGLAAVVVALLTLLHLLAGSGVARAQPPAPLAAADRARALATGRVGEAVMEAFERSPRVPVVVLLEGAAPGGRGVVSPGRSADVRRRQRRVIDRLSAEDFELTRRFERLDGFAGRVSPGGLLQLLHDGRVLRVDFDGGGRGHLAQAAPLANLDEAHALGWTGAGVTVAILDSGFDPAHVDLDGAVDGEACFCSGGGGCCPGGGTTGSGPGAAADDHGHGTNVTGIVTSDGLVAPAGSAPAARIVAVKVLDENNAFQSTSDVIAGLDWILANRPDVDVVNLSLGTFATYTGACDGADAFTQLFAQAIDALHALDVVTIVASLNGGSTTRMSAPACIERAISVGAVWDASLGSRTAFGCTDATTAAGAMTCWSNRNPTTDLFAPGALITSAGLGGGTSTFQGTSQAAPLVAGCVAALLEMDPGLRAHEVELALRLSPTQVSDPVTGIDYPRLDCEAALDVAQGPDVPLPRWLPAACLLALLALARGPLGAGGRAA